MLGISLNRQYESALNDLIEAEKLATSQDDNANIKRLYNKINSELDNMQHATNSQTKQQIKEDSTNKTETVL
jgi:hypothetical protein